ncbi:MAG TPA: hypothetical protein VGV88_05435, partial [Candidatus Dormibacteraeota bacterium]|nr:hypothetical protein [Candidatus Dormibacteraeota bacterium]
RSVTISLTKAEALVLFEWLHLNEAREDSFTTDHYDIHDPSDRAALWSLSGALERTLVEPFLSNYNGLVEAARAELRPRGESTEG